MTPQRVTNATQMKKRCFIKTLSALLAVTLAASMGCGPPPDPKTQLLGKWKETTQPQTTQKDIITEFAPGGRYTETGTWNGQQIAEKGTYTFTAENRVQIINDRAFGGARAVSSLDIEFNGNTLTLSNSMGEKRPRTYERVQ